MKSIKYLLRVIYNKLYKEFGPRNWWPADSPFEVIIGAILTQNTSWNNVERAIDNLKKEDLLRPEGLKRISKLKLAHLIKPSGYYRVKADRIKAFINFIFDKYDGSLDKMKRENIKTLREKLLMVNGIGPETADSIILYALKKPIFVVDAYTKRILSRHNIISIKASYNEVQELFMTNLPHDERLFNEYHALLVHLGKNFCRKKPKCDICPIRDVRSIEDGILGEKVKRSCWEGNSLL